MKFYFSRLWISCLSFLVAVAAYLALVCRVDSSCFVRPFVRAVPSYVFESFSFFFILATPALLLITLLKPERFHAWAKFTIGWFIFSVVLVTVFPESNNVWVPFIQTSKEQVALYLGATYAILNSIFVLLSLVTPKR